MWVHGNAGAIEDALRNLIENAVSHAPLETEVSVSVSPDGAVEVTDHGPGVAAGDREHIFERFWRGRGSHDEGVGLGLAIVASRGAWRYDRCGRCPGRGCRVHAAAEGR
jgi:signal transduction histidine kinase